MESARTIGLDIAGMDIIFNGDIRKVSEVNCAPGFKGFELATDGNVPLYSSPFELESFKRKSALNWVDSVIREYHES